MSVQLVIAEKPSEAGNQSDRPTGRATLSNHRSLGCSGVHSNRSGLGRLPAQKLWLDPTVRNRQGNHLAEQFSVHRRLDRRGHDRSNHYLGNP